MKHQITVTYTLEDTRLKRARISNNTTPMDDISALKYVAHETINGLSRIDQEIIDKAKSIINPS